MNEARRLESFVNKVKEEHKVVIEETEKNERKLYDTVVWESKYPKSKFWRTYLFVFESKSAGDDEAHMDIDLLTGKSVSEAVDKFIELQYGYQPRRELVRIRLIALAL
ncbi:MAG: hypothetical protein LYZ66_02860 [Nitrososphaerales archaeon]|nr:hypothetical protein [Nitrososphaerales archaeon]